MTVQFDDVPTVTLESTNATDLSVARAAWVSTAGIDAREKDSDRLPGLINFLMRERHGSPFEHNTFTFLITTPIFVIREFHRHRIGWSYNEMSGRYTEMKSHFYMPNDQRNLIQVGKPGAYTFSAGSDDQYNLVVKEFYEAAQEDWARYQRLLDAGIAKEVARMPLGLNLYSTFYATCNARSLMSFLSLRTESPVALNPGHPMFEIQQVANRMEAIFAEQMPLTHQTWNDNGRVAP